MDLNDEDGNGDAALIIRVGWEWLCVFFAITVATHLLPRFAQFASCIGQGAWVLTHRGKIDLSPISFDAMHNP